MVNTTTIGVLALQGDVREHVIALSRCGVAAVPVKTLKQLESVQGLVLPGGESTTIMKLASQYELVEPVKERIRSGFPVFGSCAGMILLADHIEGGTDTQETFGGISAVVQRNAFGRQAESFESLVRLADDTDLFTGVFIRAPLVTSLGNQVKVISTIEGGAYAGRIVGIEQENLMATAFHPELTSDLRVHHRFVDLVNRSQR